MQKNKPVIYLESYFFATLVALPPCMIIAMLHMGDIFGVVMYSVIFLLLFSLLFLLWSLITIIPLQKSLSKYKNKFIPCAIIGATPGLFYLLLSEGEKNELVLWAIIYGALLFGLFQYFLEKRGYNKSFKSGTPQSGAF